MAKVPAAARHSGRLSRAPPADGRPAGAGVPVRPDPNRHVRLRQRRQQPQLPDHRRSDGHHDLSHHGGDTAKQEKIQKINRFHVAQFAYILQKLKSIPEGDGTLLDHCMIVYGSGISDGNAHTHDDLPILLAGKADGTIKTGRHIRLPRGDAVDQSLRVDARPDGGEGRWLRRQHGKSSAGTMTTELRVEVGIPGTDSRRSPGTPYAILGQIVRFRRAGGFTKDRAVACTQADESSRLRCDNKKPSVGRIQFHREVFLAAS